MPIVSVFEESAEALVRLVDGVKDDQWDRPGLGVWTVRQLTGHAGRGFTTLADYLAAPPPAEATFARAELYYAAFLAQKTPSLPATPAETAADNVTAVSATASRNMGAGPMTASGGAVAGGNTTPSNAADDDAARSGNAVADADSGSLVHRVVRSGSAAEHADEGSAVQAVARSGNAADDAVAARGVQAGIDLGGDPAGTVRVWRDEAYAALAGQPLDRLVETRFGAMSLDEYLRTRVFELVVHGLDLARATGQLLDTVPVSGIATSLELAGDIAAATNQGAALLLALTARDPLPATFSVV